MNQLMNKTKFNTRKLKGITLATLLCVSLLFSASGCRKTTTKGGNGTTSTAQSVATPNAEFDALMDELFEDEISESTLSMHFVLKDPEAYGITRPEATFGDLDKSDFEGEEDWEEVEETYEKLKSFDYDTLTKEQQLTCTVLKRYMENNLAAKDLQYYTTCFGEVTGAPGNLPLDFCLFNFVKKQDIEDYLSLLDQVDEYMDYAIAYEEFRCDKECGMTDEAIDVAIEQCNTFLAERENNCMITTFENKINEVTFLTQEEVQQYKEKNRELMNNVVYPAFEDTIDGLNGLRGKSVDKGGLCNYKDGKETYEYILKYKTGSEKTVREQEKAYEQALNDAQNMIYDVYSNAPDVINAYSSGVEFEIENDLEEPEEFIEFYKAQMAGHFPDPPEITYTVSDIDPSIADNLAPAFCVTPYVDDKTHGMIQVNRTGSVKSAGDLSSTYAHEGYPGHLYQLYYYENLNPYPVREILSFLGYEEGWATVMEMRSYNLMEYKGYDSTYVRELKVAEELEEMALCCLCDIKINYDGYDVDQLTDYINDLGFNGAAASDIYTLMITEPGYYPQYFLGYLEHCELRNYAEKQLGADFDEVEYYRVVLETGPCDFKTLREEVDAYIDSVK